MKKWAKEYQILTSFRLAGESSGYHLRIIDDFEPKSREDTKAYLSRVEKELLQDCPGANIILGPMVILMVWFNLVNGLQLDIWAFLAEDLPVPAGLVP